jgi:hypothetical protein
MSRKVYESGCHHVERRESGFYVITTKTGRIQQVYASLADAKKWFFGVRL